MKAAHLKVRCSCGSGRDAHDCCLPYPNVFGIKLARYRAAYRRVSLLLDRFIESGTCRQWLKDGLGEYYLLDDDLELVTAEVLVEPEEKLRFFPWLAWDFTHPTLGRRLGDAFIAQNWDRLGEFDQRVLATMRDTVTAFFEIEEVIPHLGAWAHHIAENETVFIYDEFLSDDIEVGDLILARLLVVDGYSLVNTIYSHLSAQYLPMVTQYVHASEPGRHGEFGSRLPETLRFLGNLQDLLDDSLFTAPTRGLTATADRMFREVDPDPIHTR